MNRARTMLLIATCLSSLPTTLLAAAGEFRSAWPVETKRTWIGRDYWANRLQDWEIHRGRLECVEASPRKPMRTVHLLTAALGPQPGSFAMSVRTGPIEAGGKLTSDTWTGFLLGAGGSHVDYRLTALVHHRPAEDGGLLAAIDGTGRVMFRDNGRSRDEAGPWAITGPLGRDELSEFAVVSQDGPGFGDQPVADVELRLEARPAGDRYHVTLSAYNHRTRELISRAVMDDVEPHYVDGSLALVSNLGPAGSKSGYWFRDWEVSGSKVVRHDERAYGPILCAQHTLSRGVLKMTAQMPPLGKDDTRSVRLQVRSGENDRWRTVDETPWIERSCTAPFRVENWDATRPAEYRIVYHLRTGPGSTEPCYWEGTVRQEPAESEELVVAAFTGNKNYTGGLKWNSSGIWFPHHELVAAVRYHRPDLLFFSGDQLYEGDLTGAEMKPLDRAMLDYLDKWYRWCWAFGDLARDIPCICIPDDHDVYHGNVWGAGGRAAKSADDGGYLMPPEFVNAVQRTQTSHLPDPVDPRPVKQGIEVYFTRLEYAGVSFAVLEDRKWKSSPTVAVPGGRVVNGWFQNPDFDPATQADVPGAELLGERQLDFLRDWANDWSGGAWMKVALSQTIFANVATLPAEATSDDVVPKLQRLLPGDYPKNDRRVADADSNGWPQTGRNKALRELRRGFAFHIAGDQHLGSFTRYGIDDWDDAGYALCVPSIGNAFPRRWYPAEPGKNRKPGAPAYAGQFKDGFGNFVTVHAVSNPTVSGHEPAMLYDRAPGYGIVRLNRPTREIVVECWPRWVDPSQAGAEQYPGWPFTIRQLDNYGRRAEAYLPTLRIVGRQDPVVQIIDEADGEIVYTLRIAGSSFRPYVFAEGTYTIRVGDPDRKGEVKTLRGVRTTPKSDGPMIEINF